MLNLDHWYEILAKLCPDAMPELFHRTLLWGPPGTGKSTWPERQFGAVERLPLHRDMAFEDMVGGKDLRSDGKGGMDSVWSDGPAITAMRKGIPLVIDEIDAFSPEIRCLLHALMDDRAIARITLPTGEVVRPAPGFCVFATTNKNPEMLPEPIRDRFEFVLYCHDPHPGILDNLSAPFRKILQNHYKNLPREKYSTAFSARSITTLHKMIQSKIFTQEECCRLMFPGEADTILNALGCLV